MSEQHTFFAVSRWIQLKWIVFRAAAFAANAWNSLRARKSRAYDARSPRSNAGADDRLWIFASTIGELNAIEPFLKALLAKAGDLRLLFVCDHEHYRAAYLAKYPDAEFACLHEDSDETARLARTFPPHALLIAEIPCMLFDAPCRFSFAVLYEVKRRRAPVFLINGWLYHHSPSSRMDELERLFFHRDYLRLIDAFLVQTDEVKRQLIVHGATPEQVTVIGNIKFDAVTRMPWSPDQAKDPSLLRAIAASGRQCIVAGCVTNLDDQQAILDVFRMVLVARPRTLLVLAPRHPEVKERMVKLESFLQERNFVYVFRSRLAGVQLDPYTQVLVLDTMGELRDFYALATLTYVGPNHNVLEPLAFDKPVFVKPGWEATYPSYPVYRLLLDSGAIVELNENGDLARAWLEFLTDEGRYRSHVQETDLVLNRAAGATRRALDALAATGFSPGA